MGDERPPPKNITDFYPELSPELKEWVEGMAKAFLGKDKPLVPFLKREIVLGWLEGLPSVNNGNADCNCYLCVGARKILKIYRVE